MSTNRYIDKLKARLAKEVDQRMHLQALLDDQVARNRALLAERDAISQITEIRCEGCGYMVHDREHMGCVRAAKSGGPSLRELRMLDALEYALPYLEACIPNPRNGVNHDGSLDVNAVQRARDAIASCRAALQGAKP